MAMGKIGIAISTYNRPEVLQCSLEYIKRYTDSDIHIAVFDDGSTTHQKNNEICLKHGVEYYHKENVGIAKNKNRGIKRFNTYDHVFLLDDDIFPKKHGWIEYYITSAQSSGNHHLLYMFENATGRDHHKVSKDHGNGITEFHSCGGVLVYIDKKVIQTVGGFNKNFGIYGYEHAEYSRRIHRAGFTPNGQYIAPSQAYDYVCSLDYNITTDGRLFLDVKNERDQVIIEGAIFRTSITDNSLKEESINRNSELFRNSEKYPIYQDYN